MILLVALVVACVLLVGWLTAAGTAVRSVSRIWLRHWAEQRLAGSGAGESLLARPQRLVLAAAAGTALAVAAAGAALGAAAGGDPWRLTGLAALLALVLLVLGQLVPRAIARRWAPQVLSAVMPPLDAAAFVLSPLLDAARAAARPLSPRRRTAAEEVHEELEDLLRAGEMDGLGGSAEIDIITGLVEFGEKVVRDVMTPRTEVFAVDEAMPPREMARAIAQSGYSRVPVYRESLDQVIGMVHVFDVLKTGGDAVPPIRPVAQAPLTKRCSEVLFEMLRAQRHLAVVLDEFGGTAGIVTLEDVLEELVGDIRDEHDEPAPAEAAREGGAGAAVVLDGSAPLDELERRTGLSLSGDAAGGDRAQTLGGAVVRALGRIPVVGERVRVGDFELVVVDAEPARVRHVLVQRIETARPIEIRPPGAR